MANHHFFIEKQDDGSWSIKREGAERASKVTETQKQAIDQLAKMDPQANPDVERVRTTKFGRPGEWRSAS